MNALYLNHIDPATQEDIDNGLVIRAKLFQADTREALRYLIMEHPTYKEVAETMFYVDADTSARSIAEAHEKYLHDAASIKAHARSFTSYFRDKCSCNDSTKNVMIKTGR